MFDNFFYFLFLGVGVSRTLLKTMVLLTLLKLGYSRKYQDCYMVLYVDAIKLLICPFDRLISNGSPP